MNPNDIYERIIIHMIDDTREEMIKNDAEYLELERRCTELENEYLKNENYKNAIDLLGNYIARIQETNMRFADISYLCGIKDTILFLVSIGLLSTKNMGENNN